MAKMLEKVSICWLRRDLRLHDHAALSYALQQPYPVIILFIFDKHILSELPRDDKRVVFIYQQLLRLQLLLQENGSSLLVRHATPEEAYAQLVKQYDIQGVYVNHDYEPYAIQREDRIRQFLQQQNIPFNTYKDQVIFEKNEVVKDDGKPYTVFTPYSKKWKALFSDSNTQAHPVESHLHNLYQDKNFRLPDLEELGFEGQDISFPSPVWSTEIIKHYHETRDIPGIEGTSKLSVHLRFGTVSIRHLVKEVKDLNEKFLNELIWREFYQQILFHFPHVVDRSFKPAYDEIKWRNDEDEFKKWCDGQTGYPIVDAGMRELNATGWMHNRVRMVVASFLTKHLLIDWRWGESYFAQKLLDFDLASNNGGWQWAAGCGVDAAPYFRVFNPYLQTLKFDPQLNYIRKWVPEYESLTYVRPMVDHDFARKRCLEVYKSALNNENY